MPKASSTVRRGTATSGAVFSACERYRYRLWRRWGEEPHAVFIGMNPSTADEINNDPTIERFIRRVHRWREAGQRIGGVEVVNVYAWRQTDSRELMREFDAGTDVVGPLNDRAIREACEGAMFVLCGWGKPGIHRQQRVLSLLPEAPLHALRVNADGTPVHPLYVGYDTVPVRFPR